MSRFFSRKYLQYREQARQPRIDTDFYCRRCGYNLRSLRYGGNCPECGSLIELNQPLQDVLLDAGEPARARWKTGFMLLMIGGCVAGFLPMLEFFFALGGPNSTIDKALSIIAATAAIIWTIGVFRVTPPVLQAKWEWVGGPRLSVRVLSCGWIVGFGCLLLARLGWKGGNLFTLIVLGLLAGAVSVLLLIWVLRWIASEAELEDVERRFRVSLWVLPVAGLAVAALSAASLPWSTLKAVPGALIIPAFVLGVWGWSLYLVLRSLHGLREHIRWADLIAASGVGREQRIATKRRAIEQEVEAQIRPLPDLANGDRQSPVRESNEADDHARSD